MNQKLAQDLNILKERRTKLESEMNMKMNQYHEQLRKLDHDILDLSEAVRLDIATERGTDRTSNWNRELEGNLAVEGTSEPKHYEREYIYDSAHRKE